MILNKRSSLLAYRTNLDIAVSGTSTGSRKGCGAQLLWHTLSTLAVLPYLSPANSLFRERNSLLREQWDAASTVKVHFSCN